MPSVASKHSVQPKGQPPEACAITSDSCDICGKPAETRAFVEGALMSVCRNCASYGRVLKDERRSAGPREIRVAADLFVIDGYGKAVTGAAAAKGMTLHDVAAKLFINEGYLKQMASGERKPDVKTAQKLEKELGVTLLTETKPETKVEAKPASAPAPKGVTLGDVVLIRKKG